jgi:hypothetical protein
MATATRVAGDKEGDGGKSDDNDTSISLAMAMTTRVAGDKESDGRKSDGNDEKGCGRSTAMATKRAMAAATRAVGNKEGNGKGGESDGDTYKEGDGEEEGEYKGGESNGDGEEDGEGNKGDGDCDKEGNGKEEGKGNCNSVFGAQNKCLSQHKKKRSHIWAVANHKSQICDCDSQTQMRYGNAPVSVISRATGGTTTATSVRTTRQTRDILF